MSGRGVRNDHSFWNLLNGNYCLERHEVAVELRDVTPRKDCGAPGLIPLS